MGSSARVSPLLTAATLVSRPNRFIVVCDTRDQKGIRAHLPNPGRLAELFLPGATLLLEPSEDPGRTTAWTALAVLRDGIPVPLHTGRANDVVERLLTSNAVPGLRGARVLRREVTVGRSRFDFLLRYRGRDLFLEVKSCTLFGGRVAMFPDAVTERGRRHLDELAHLAEGGTPTAVLVACQRGDLDWFMPDWHTDLAFARTLLEVRDRVLIIPVAIPWGGDLEVRGPLRRLRIPWRHLEANVVDAGTVILLYRLAEGLHLYGRDFPPGWYGGIDETTSNLSALVERRLHGRGRPTDGLDRLRNGAADRVALPVRGAAVDAQAIHGALAELGRGGDEASGLVSFDGDPRHRRTFHDMLERFRMYVGHDEGPRPRGAAVV